jgi:thiamine biosynthesis lipoprotein
MGCEAHVVLVGSRRGEMNRVRRQLEHLELRWSRFLADSDISRLNRARGSSVAVHADTVRLFEVARRGFDMTGGRFDPTVLASVEARGYVTSLDEGMPAFWTAPPIPASGLAAVQVDAERALARLDVGVGFDPGAVGKGLAADMAVEGLIDRGVTGALVSIGGDLAVAGESPQGGPWAVSVEDPLDPRRDVAVLHLPAGGIATSTARHGRWFTSEGPAPHVIDPSSGAVVGSEVASVTVVAESAATAEMVATAALVAGQGDGLALIDHLGLHGLMVDADGELHHSARLGVPA